jgi:hypothetical protein
VIEDRSMVVQPEQLVETAWVDVDNCVLGCRERMDFAAIERAGRMLLQLGAAQSWPPIVGHWREQRFVVDDGRHEFLAALALGRTRLFVAWLNK